jgi:hypothetical protein
MIIYVFYNYQIVHGTNGHMAIYGPGCHPQNIIWTEAKLRSLYYFVGDRPVHKLPIGPMCHELFAILYSIHANLSDDMFLLLYIKDKKTVRKKILYWSGPVHILKYWPVNIRKYWPVAITKTNRENKNVEV